jgi:hypothetical protein
MPALWEPIRPDSELRRIEDEQVRHPGGVRPPMGFDERFVVPQAKIGGLEPHHC